LNKYLLHKEVQQFINNNLKADIPSLVLKGSPFEKVNIKDLANQILSKSKCRNKLPRWFMTEGIYYHNPVNIEQTSSEITAQYKARLISGKSLVDLTGGFGVDSYFLAKKFQQLTHCEIDTELSQIAAYNFTVLGAKNVRCIAEDGISFLQNTADKFDWLFVDPSRRSDLKGKVFLLEDCLPNIVDHLDLMLHKSRKLLIKLSPILDINAVIHKLKNVKEVHIVAHMNEVKELLLVIEKDLEAPVNIKTINFKKNTEDIFEAVYNTGATSKFSFPKTYLFEPNAAILKAGFFNEVSQQFDVHKLHVNSHLYTSDKLINFPGRRFKILSSFKYNPKEIKKNFSVKKANITIRNFYDTVAHIRKKTGIKEGGTEFLFFTTDVENQPLVIHCQKV
jgi:16S rRNA G966 N2-methylase RsmD